MFPWFHFYVKQITFDKWRHIFIYLERVTACVFELTGYTVG